MRFSRLSCLSRKYSAEAADGADRDSARPLFVCFRPGLPLFCGRFAAKVPASGTAMAMTRKKDRFYLFPPRRNVGVSCFVSGPGNRRSGPGLMQTSGFTRSFSASAISERTRIALGLSKTFFFMRRVAPFAKTCLAPAAGRCGTSCRSSLCRAVPIGSAGGKRAPAERYVRGAYGKRGCPSIDRTASFSFRRHRSTSRSASL